MCHWADIFPVYLSPIATHSHFTPSYTQCPWFFSGYRQCCIGCHVKETREKQSQTLGNNGKARRAVFGAAKASARCCQPTQLRNFKCDHMSELVYWLGLATGFSPFDLI